MKLNSLRRRHVVGRRRRRQRRRAAVSGSGDDRLKIVGHRDHLVRDRQRRRRLVHAQVRVEVLRNISAIDAVSIETL